MMTGPGAAELLTRVAQDPRARRFVESRGVSASLVRRCIAGESLTAELDVTGELLARGRLVSATYLAADPIDRSEAKDRRKRLRKLLGRHGNYIQTVWGVGYKLALSEVERPQ